MVRAPQIQSTPQLTSHNLKADPITPFASAQKTANLLGDNAFLVEQLGYGHTSLAQTSSCTLGIMVNYVANSTVSRRRWPMLPVHSY